MAEMTAGLLQRWLNFSEAEAYSGLSESTLRRLIAENRLKVFRPTQRKVLFDRLELDELMLSAMDQAS